MAKLQKPYKHVDVVQYFPPGADSGVPSCARAPLPLAYTRGYIYSVILYVRTYSSSTALKLVATLPCYNNPPGSRMQCELVSVTVTH